MSAITWDRDDHADWGAIGGHKRYMVRAGHLYYNQGGQDWRFIGSVIGSGHSLAEVHWAGLQDRIRQLAAAELGLTTTHDLVGAPRALEPDEAAKLYAAIDALPPSPVAPPPTRRTLWINGVVLTGEVRSISTHTHGDGTQSIDISFVPDNAADTVRVIESMRVDQ